MTSENLKKDVGCEIDYIKSILTKSQFSFRLGAKFFFLLAAWFLIHNVAAWTFGFFYLFHLSDPIQMKIGELLFKLVLLVPILLLLLYFRKKVKKGNEGLSLWLLDACGFTIFACALSADVFAIIATGLCMFLCGIFIESIPLKKVSVVYVGAGTLILTLAGVLYAYNRYVSPLTAQELMHTVYNYTHLSVNIFYPSVGFTLLGIFLLKRIKKQV
jgi:hypothetical protein